MKKKFIFILSIYLSLNLFCTKILANSDTTIKIDPDKIKEGINNIFSGKIPKPEIALRGNKLSDFFIYNNLSLNFDEKKKNTNSKMGLTKYLMKKN